VTVVRAEARFAGPRIVEAGGQRYTAPVIVIDTGTTAAVPGIPGLAQTPYLTNTTFFELRTLPKRFVAIGGGYIGLELGQGIARAGSEVTILHRAGRVLEREEPDVSATLQEALGKDGIRLELGVEIANVSYEDGTFDVRLKDGRTVGCDALLVATGRTPNTAALQCSQSGIELDDAGFVRVDNRLRTTCEGVYAIGDVAGQPQFTHVSWEDYRRLKTILAGGDRTRADRVLGYAVYTEPQVGRAGLTLAEARKAGHRAREVTYPLSKVARAVEWNEELGFYRMTVDEDTSKILGATLVGYEAGEIVHVILAHMEAGSTWQVLDRSVHIHPTYAEGLPTLARQLA
jgi:dihydrolipoamide dehydrogenase